MRGATRELGDAFCAWSCLSAASKKCAETESRDMHGNVQSMLASGDVGILPAEIGIPTDFLDKNEIKNNEKRCFRSEL